MESWLANWKIPSLIESYESMTRIFYAHFLKHAHIIFKKIQVSLSGPWILKFSRQLCFKMFSSTHFLFSGVSVLFLSFIGPTTTLSIVLYSLLNLFFHISFRQKKFLLNKINFSRWADGLISSKLIQSFYWMLLILIYQRVNLEFIICYIYI